MRLIGRLGEPRHRVVVVVGLLDLAIGCRDLAHQGDARGEDRGAFKLHLHALRVHHAAGIHHQVHARDPHLPLLVDLDVDHRGHIAEKTPMRRKAQRTTLPWLFVRPAGALRRHCDHALKGRDLDDTCSMGLWIVTAG